MAHIWFCDDARRWGFHSLAEGACGVSIIPEGVVFNPPAGANYRHPSDMLLLQTRPPPAPKRGSSWPDAPLMPVLTARPLLGIRALRTRTKCRSPAIACFSRPNNSPAWRPFPVRSSLHFVRAASNGWSAGSGGQVPAPPGVASSVRKFPCWTYDSTCALCQHQLTALDGAIPDAGGSVK
jgi:hypothetical protein